MSKKIVLMLAMIMSAVMMLPMTACLDSDTALDNDVTDSYAYEDYGDDNSNSENTTEAQMSMGHKNALKTAQSYLNYTSFSYSGLIEQLEYEGFSTEDSTFAVNNCGADWNEQAAKKAQSYLDYSSFSRQGLIEQLEYEGFTHEQAEYGVTAVGY